MALLRGGSPKRAPSTSDVRQRPSTNAELPVDGSIDGRDDQLTSGGRAAAPPISPALVTAIKPDLDSRMRKEHAHATIQVRMREAQRRGGNRYRGCSYLRCVLCADRGGTETPLI